MRALWTTNQISFAAIGGFIGWFLGGCDGLLYALIAFIVIDYITGVMCAIVNAMPATRKKVNEHAVQVTLLKKN